MTGRAAQVAAAAKTRRPDRSLSDGRVGASNNADSTPLTPPLPAPPLPAPGPPGCSTLACRSRCQPLAVVLRVPVIVVTIGGVPEVASYAESASTVVWLKLPQPSYANTSSFSVALELDSDRARARRPMPSYVVSIDLTVVSKPEPNVWTSRSTTRPAVLYVVSIRFPAGS